jgi:hypothetical protein
MKKVLLIVIDALATRVVAPALLRGSLPHLQTLVERGRMYGNCVPIFPSITPAATCAIVTGCYPRHSGVAGAYFYDTRHDRVHYYGDDFWAILNEGFAKFFRDFLIRMNFSLLKRDTLFEHVERHGLRAACINYLWFRGDVTHTAHVPWLLRLLPGIPFATRIRGPQILCLGDFVTTQPKRTDRELRSPGGPFRRFGFDDTGTAGYLLDLAQKTGLPDLTLAYFPDNDFRSHKVGPVQAVTTLQEFDQTLGELIGVLGGVERLLQQFAVFITGDHSQTDMLADEQTTWIDLDAVLHEFDVVAAGNDWENDDQLMVCPNMRAAQIYLRRRCRREQEHIVRLLLGDSRVDQVFWRRDAEDTPRNAYHVATRDRGRLQFWVSDQPAAVRDEYGGGWMWEGDLETVDGRLGARQEITFPEYPNAFERIAAAFHSDVTGDLWVTARPGHEFHTARTARHDGGSHGSLHREDSQVPLIVAGLPDDVSVPVPPRTVDVAPLCLGALGLPAPWPAGASHAGRP